VACVSGFGGSVPHRAWEEVAIFELAQEVGDEEAAEHKAHGQQRRVGVGGKLRRRAVAHVLRVDMVEGVE